MDSVENLKNEIENIWLAKQTNQPFDKTKALFLAEKIIQMLDDGKIRVAEKLNNSSSSTSGSALWKINEWIKKAILLSFTSDNNIRNAFDGNFWYDKVDGKFKNWTENDFQQAGIRAVDGCFVRKGSFFGKKCIIMPSFVNLGVYVDEGTMIDSMTTIGSCAQIGKNCHISANVCIGGVLEPLQANPVIIEDNCFIGTGCQITEGTIIGEGSVIASGTTITSGVKIINRETNEVLHGKVPPYSVVVSGCYKSINDVYINCAVIIKQIDKNIRAKTSINELLR